MTPLLKIKEYSCVTAVVYHHYNYPPTVSIGLLSLEHNVHIAPLRKKNSNIWGARNMRQRLWGPFDVKPQAEMSSPASSSIQYIIKKTISCLYSVCFLHSSLQTVLMWRRIHFGHWKLLRQEKGKLASLGGNQSVITYSLKELLYLLRGLIELFLPHLKLL